MQSKLPPLPTTRATKTQTDLYRQLGAATLLEICSREHADQEKDSDGFDRSLKNHYGQLVRWMRSGSFHLMLDPERKPVGYAGWSFEQGHIRLLRACHPFESRTGLVRSLESRFPGIRIG